MPTCSRPVAPTRPEGPEGEVGQSVTLPAASRRPWRRLAAAIVVAVLAASCGSDGEPSGFADDPGPLDSALVGALDEGEDVDNVPLVERNFLDLCVRGGESTIPELPAVQERGLLRVCACSYDALVEHVREVATRNAGDDADADDIENDAYSRFRTIDDDMRNGIVGDLDPQVRRLFADCVRSEAF